jgi:hypothetical protein
MSHIRFGAASGGNFVRSFSTPSSIASRERALVEFGMECDDGVRVWLAPPTASLVSAGAQPVVEEQTSVSGRNDEA